MGNSFGIELPKPKQFGGFGQAPVITGFGQTPVNSRTPMLTPLNSLSYANCKKLAESNANDTSMGARFGLRNNSYNGAGIGSNYNGILGNNNYYNAVLATKTVKTSFITAMKFKIMMQKCFALDP